MYFNVSQYDNTLFYLPYFRISNNDLFSQITLVRYFYIDVVYGSGGVLWLNGRQ